MGKGQCVWLCAKPCFCVSTSSLYYEPTSYVGSQRTQTRLARNNERARTSTLDSEAAHSEREGQQLCNRAQLLVGTHATHLLRHELAKHGDHRQPAVLQLFQLFVGELHRILRFETQKRWDLTGDLRVVLLCNGELVNADQRDDLEPARCRNCTNRSNATRDVVEVKIQRWREQLMRRRDQLIRANSHANERNHAHTYMLDLDNTAAV